MRNRYYDRKKKVLVIYPAGAPLLLQLGKKSSSCLSGGCMIIITTGKQKVLVICLAHLTATCRLEWNYHLSKKIMAFSLSNIEIQ